MGDTGAPPPVYTPSWHELWSPDYGRIGYWEGWYDQANKPVCTRYFVIADFYLPAVPVWVLAGVRTLVDPTGTGGDVPPGTFGPGTSPIPPPPMPLPPVPTPPLFLTQPWNQLIDVIRQVLLEIYTRITRWFVEVVQWILTTVWPMVLEVFGWLGAAEQWIIAQIAPLISQVWGWIQGIVASVGEAVNSALAPVWDWINKATTSILAGVGSLLSQVYSWLNIGFQALTQTVAGWFGTLATSIAQLGTFVATKVQEINAWFSTEFIDPFLDWLLQFPGKLTESLTAMVNALASRFEAWLTHRSPGFPGIIAEWYRMLNDWITSRVGFFTPGSPVYQGETAGIWALLGMGVLSGFSQVVSWASTVIDALAPSLVQAAVSTFRWLGFLVQYYGAGLGAWIVSLLPRLLTWLGARWFPVFTSSLVIGLGATGTLQQLIDSFVTPKIMELMSWAESMGPLAPGAGTGPTTSVTKLISFTISGLASMTLMGEALSPLKHLGMGHISAMLYDLINYKVLTAAFVGVLAFVYIKTPLTYYYNKIARPNLPDERGLSALRSQYVISSREYAEGMQYQGYPDKTITQLEDTVFRPMTPYMLRNLAEAGLLDDQLLDHALHQAGYDEISIPFIKRMMQTLAAGTLATVSVSTAMTRYREGFDDEATLRNNLSVLGVADAMLDRYVYAANLQYLYDYQTDLKTFYIDQYHRREIEEPELRSDLVSAGLNVDRIDLVVQAQSIKRLKAAAAAEDPALALQLDTIRDRRKKRLITRDEEIRALVALGKELGYATAIADNDDVALVTAGAPPAVAPPLAYETEAGKVEVDTIRRLRRGGQSTPDEELAALRSLDMPAALAQAIVDNDTLRVKKSAATGE